MKKNFVSAGIICLLLFASCKNNAVEVLVKYDTGNMDVKHYYEGEVTGYLGDLIVKSTGSISYTTPGNSTSTNVKNYTFRFKATPAASVSIPIEIQKIGNTYSCTTDPSAVIVGNPESSEFAVKGVHIVGYTNTGNLVFKRF